MQKVSNRGSNRIALLVIALPFEFSNHSGNTQLYKIKYNSVELRSVVFIWSSALRNSWCLEIPLGCQGEAELGRFISDPPGPNYCWLILNSLMFRGSEWFHLKYTQMLKKTLCVCLTYNNTKNVIITASIYWVLMVGTTCLFTLSHLLILTIVLWGRSYY